MNTLRVIREDGTDFAHPITDGHNRVKMLVEKLVEALWARLAHIETAVFHDLYRQRMDLRCTPQ